MAEKVTVMLLEVDLQCPCCYKKVKKVLCKFPQIRDQVYDEKNNTVKITVVCCSPEKIWSKLCCKGGKTIKSIEIIELPPPQPKDSVKPKTPEKPNDVKKPKKPPAEKPPPEKPKEVPVGICCGPCYHGVPGGPCYHGCGTPPSPPPPPQAWYGYDVCQCGCGGYRGCRGYYTAYGVCQCGCGGYRGCRGYYTAYFSEENPSACTIM